MDEGRHTEDKEGNCRKMRMGKVCVGHFYAVDLDDEEMVRQAKDSVYEDVMAWVKYDELWDYIDVEEDGSLVPGDIPEFLRHDPSCDD